ncbi:hypothetical protein GWK47_025964 [Chionoecetes opilio]|uniref:Uncharacterized protein n=1 Tax=Chionoecetes opilio TaxID=41210 RepID=A0A8J8WAR3_CHIOP|nr:hypothetical protein GWK47_025964 [Chionoecetes opilio]
MVKSIRVDFESGDIVEAPLDFVISLRPKSKVINPQSESNEVTISNSRKVIEKLEDVNSEISTVKCEVHSEETASQAPQQNESMEVDENSSVEDDKKTETMSTDVIDAPPTPCEDQGMEVEPQSETDKLQNGHIDEKPEEVMELACNSKESVKSSESKLSELSQPLGKGKESSQSET